MQNSEHFFFNIKCKLKVHTKSAKGQICEMFVPVSICKRAVDHLLTLMNWHFIHILWMIFVEILWDK